MWECVGMYVHLCLCTRVCECKCARVCARIEQTISFSSRYHIPMEKKSPNHPLVQFFTTAFPFNSKFNM